MVRQAHFIVTLSLSQGGFRCAEESPRKAFRAALPAFVVLSCNSTDDIVQSTIFFYSISGNFSVPHFIHDIICLIPAGR